MLQKIVIFASNGFIGKYLIHFFSDKCIHLITINRQAETVNTNNRTHLLWDGKTLGDWFNHIDNADIIMNLAGKSVNCRYTEANKVAIFSSRLDSTAVIGKAIQQLANPPKVWMNMSSATIYRHAEDHYQDEYSGELGKGFSVEVCKAWEKTCNDVNTPNTRKVLLRTSITLGKDDGAFTRILRLVKFYLGGKQGSGKQMFSWIHIHDLARTILFIYQNNNIEGVCNLVTPNAITNNTFMQTVRKSLQKPFGLSMPTWLLKFGAVLIGTELELILKSRWVYPTKLLQAGFVFEYNTIEEACEEIVKKYVT